MQSLSVDELKRLPCARLSAADLFALSPDRLLMIDVRPCDQLVLPALDRYYLLQI